MPPRRKKAAAKESPIVPDDAGGFGAASESKPKKTTKATKTPAWPAFGIKPEERIPAIIPIKSAPPVSQRISIEPDVKLGEDDDVWTPRRDTDLSMPPKLLLQSKKVSKQDIEDIMAGPEDGDDEDMDVNDEFRPPVRAGSYRKIALAFAVLAILVGAGVMYAVYAHATVVVYPQKTDVKTERVLSVVTDPKAVDEIAGEIIEVTVAGEKTEAPSASTKADGTARGMATLINDSSSDQALVATTRLLTPEGVLFRLKSGVTVRAHSRIKTDVYADKPGASGDIGPSKFTIPGLNASLQKVIYAESDAAMSGGIVSTGIISAADIDKTEADLRQELVAQAQQELAKKDVKGWTGSARVAETMARAVSAGPGEVANGVTVRLTLRVRQVGFDRTKAISVASEDLQRSLTSDRELTGIKAADTAFTVDKADPKTGTASLRVALTGQSRVSLDSPLFEASKLRGLNLESVKTYFEGIEGVEHIDVKFRPFWLKRMPLLPGRIEFQIEK